MNRDVLVTLKVSVNRKNIKLVLVMHFRNAITVNAILKPCSTVSMRKILSLE